MSRLERDSYFMQMAGVVALRSTCLRAQVGCVIVDPNERRLVATGYNGAPPGSKHCEEMGCLIVNDHCMRSIHAEVNAAIRVKNGGTPGLVAYCTHSPCWDCAKVLYAAGVRRIYYSVPYNLEEVAELKKAVIPDLEFINASTPLGQAQKP